MMRDRAAKVGLAGAAVVGCVTLALVDPAGGGPYPRCPTRLLTGFDCPACGGLRGVHDLLHGRIVEALDHNLLLVLALPLGVMVGWRWLRRPIPRWMSAALIATAVVFTVAHNLPVESLRWLGSSA